MTYAQAMAMAKSPIINEEPIWSLSHEKVSTSFKSFCLQEWETHRYRRVMGIPIRRNDNEIWEILLDKWRGMTLSEKESYHEKS